MKISFSTSRFYVVGFKDDKQKKKIWEGTHGSKAWCFSIYESVKEYKRFMWKQRKNKGMVLSFEG